MTRHPSKANKQRFVTQLITAIFHCVSRRSVLEAYFEDGENDANKTIFKTNRLIFTIASHARTFIHPHLLMSPVKASSLDLSRLQKSVCSPISKFNHRKST